MHGNAIPLGFLQKCFQFPARILASTILPLLVGEGGGGGGSRLVDDVKLSADEFEFFTIILSSSVNDDSCRVPKLVTHSC